MRRPPRDLEQPLFSFRYIAWSLGQGMVALIFVAGLFVVSLHQGLPEEDARTLVFAALVATNLGLVLVNRSQGSGLRAAIQPRNTPWRLVAGRAAAILAAIIAFEPARRMFHFGPLHADDGALAIALGAIVMLALSLLKRMRLRSAAPNSTARRTKGR